VYDVVDVKKWTTWFGYLFGIDAVGTLLGCELGWNYFYWAKLERRAIENYGQRDRVVWADANNPIDACESDPPDEYAVLAPSIWNAERSRSSLIRDSAPRWILISAPASGEPAESTTRTRTLPVQPWARATAAKRLAMQTLQTTRVPALKRIINLVTPNRSDVTLQLAVHLSQPKPPPIEHLHAGGK
jgi:hypothetical protein